MKLALLPLFHFVPLVFSEHRTQPAWVYYLFFMSTGKIEVIKSWTVEYSDCSSSTIINEA